MRGASHIARILAALTLLAGCGADPVRVRVRAFEHPEDVAFACFRSDGEVVPLRECANSGDDPSVSLHALVTQGGRGQVGVVDLDENEVIDADRQVPGFTFVPVGEIPSDILVPEDNPEWTFVADVGSYDVLAVRTSALRSTRAGAEDIYVRIPMPAAPARLAISPDESTLIVSLPQDGSVALIDRASIVAGMDAPRPRFVELGASIPAPVAATPPAADYCRVCQVEDTETTEDPFGCEGLLLDPWPTDADGTRRPAVPRPPRTRGTEAAPTALIVDELNARVLIGDANLPVIHVLQLAGTTGVPGVAATGLSEPRPLEPIGRVEPAISPSSPEAPVLFALLPPIATSVPVADIALTPRVPVTVDGEVDASDPATYERYLYAIDATDRSVMAIRYDEMAPSNSAVLPVSVRGGAARDRVRLPAGARVLEVISPGYPGERCERGSAHQADAAPLQLRGVFLVAGLLNGTLHVIDVYDLDAECRGGTRPVARNEMGEEVILDQCADPADPDDSEVYIRRHRPRIGGDITTDLTLVSSPVVSTDRGTFTVDSDGSTGDVTIPGLLPFPNVDGDDMEDEIVPCDGLEEQVFPFEESEPALVCALNDPWAAEAETWLATWEGALPGTAGGRGRFGDPASNEFLLEIPVCDRGVLGRENIAALDEALYEAGYQPDLLALTGTLPPSTEDVEACQRFVDEDDPDGGLGRIEIPIVRSERREVDGDIQHALILNDGARGGVSLSDLRACFPELVTYEMRSQGAYTVLGGRTGLQHRVVADETTGACTVDPTLPETRVGRALPGSPFDNGVVRFVIEETEVPLGLGAEVEISFQITGVPRELAIPVEDDLTTVLSDIAYSEMDERLYVVDTQFKGLVRIQVTPVQVLQSFE